MSDEHPAVSVIIPNWNGLKFLPTCLESLRRQTARSFQVVLVDNGSSDGSIEFVARTFPEVQLLPLDRNYGFSEAVNRGIAATSSSYVALLNNDTEAHAAWLERCLETMITRPDIGYIASQILDFYRRDRLDSAGDTLTRSGLPLKRGMDRAAEGRYLEPCEVMGASAGAAFYRREVLDRVGPFDTGFFMYLEDVDWCLRAALLGVRCLYVPGAIVYHIEGGSDPERAAWLERGETARRAFHSRDRTYWITRNRVRLLLKNFPAGLLLRLFPWIAWGFARSALFHTIKSGLPAAYFRGLFRGLREIPECLRLRRDIQRTRTISVRKFSRILFEHQA